MEMEKVVAGVELGVQPEGPVRWKWMNRVSEEAGRRISFFTIARERRRTRG